MTKERVDMVHCRFESLSEGYQRSCLERGGYMRPVIEHVDADGVTHSPCYQNPKHNPKNITWSGEYILDFSLKYPTDPEYRKLIKLKREILLRDE